MVRLILPDEIAKHTISEGTNLVTSMLHRCYHTTFYHIQFLSFCTPLYFDLIYLYLRSTSQWDIEAQPKCGLCHFQSTANGIANINLDLDWQDSSVSH